MIFDQVVKERGGGGDAALTNKITFLALTPGQKP